MNPNDRPFEMKSQEPTDIGDNTPIILDSAEITPIAESPASSPKTDRTLWLTIGGITITACCVVFVLIYNFLGSDTIRYLVDDINYKTPTPAPTVSARALTATQIAWFPPSESPIFGTAAEAKAAHISRSQPSLTSFADKPPDQPEINQPGDVYEYYINLSEYIATRWEYGWCATTREILIQNFEQMKVEFVVNGKTLDVVFLGITESQRDDGGHCRTFTALVEKWPSGQHQLEVRVSFLKPTDDGWNLYPVGTHTFKYIVNVP